jgi:hypothetical protein
LNLLLSIVVWAHVINLNGTSPLEGQDKWKTVIENASRNSIK